MPNIAVVFTQLERMMLIAEDTKKEFTRAKCSGWYWGGQPREWREEGWYWHNRGDEENRFGPFATFYEALSVAVEPYMKD
jgi:hypothetical protein